MNRSYSKIRHIQESNQRLERRLLNEDYCGNNPEIEINKLKQSTGKYEYQIFVAAISILMNSSGSGIGVLSNNLISGLDKNNPLYGVPVEDNLVRTLKDDLNGKLMKEVVQWLRCAEPEFQIAELLPKIFQT